MPILHDAFGTVLRGLEKDCRNQKKNRDYSVDSIVVISWRNLENPENQKR